MDGRTQATRLLADGFARDFADQLTADEDFATFVMDKAKDFVDEHIPFTDEDAAFDVAMLLSDRIFEGKY